MTSDGISGEDWVRVHELAFEVAKADEDDDQPVKQLLAYLSLLTAKYGELPSILATQAGYVNGGDQSERLFLRAFDLAITREDRSNICEIALSLANLYATELRDAVSASRWLEVGRAHADPSSEADVAEWRWIEDAIERLRSQSKE